VTGDERLAKLQLDESVTAQRKGGGGGMKGFNLVSKILFFSFFLLTIAGFTTKVDALSITPSNADYYGDENDQNSVWDAIKSYIDPYDPKFPIYKSNVEPEGNEEGILKNSYNTAYFNDPEDPAEAEISWVGPSFVDTASSAWLLVKDGVQTPAWYLFDLVRLGWDGKEKLNMLEFWPQKGAISNVSIYGKERTQVPEPGTILLMGLGLIGLAGIARKRIK
jgi:hypothetical protein